MTLLEKGNSTPEYVAPDTTKRSPSALPLSLWGAQYRHQHAKLVAPVGKEVCFVLLFSALLPLNNTRKGKGSPLFRFLQIDAINKSHGFQVWKCMHARHEDAKDIGVKAHYCVTIWTLVKHARKQSQLSLLCKASVHPGCSLAFGVG
jgi:hypothetical protein